MFYVIFTANNDESCMAFRKIFCCCPLSVGFNNEKLCRTILFSGVGRSDGPKNILDYIATIVIINTNKNKGRG